MDQCKTIKKSQKIFLCSILLHVLTDALKEDTDGIAIKFANDTKVGIGIGRVLAERIQKYSTS